MNENLKSLYESLETRKKLNPANYYVPNGKIEEFIKIVGKGTFISALIAGNGVGKSCAGVNIIANLIFDDVKNKYFDYPIFRKFPFSEKRGRIISDPTTIQQTLIPELKKWFPLNKYVTSKAGKGYEYNWMTNSNHKFDILTYEQEIKEFESATLSWVWFDEPPPLAIYKASIARLRKGGIVIITATPLLGSSWLYDHIITNKADDTKQRDYIQADVESNCITHGIRGILEHSNIERMISEYDEEDKQARIFGKFQHLTGLVFKNFSKIHIIKPFEINRKDYVVVEALDPHTRNPDAVMWVAIDKEGRKIVIDELYGTWTTGELASRIKRKADNYRIVKRIADASAFIEDKHQENSKEQTLAGKLFSLGLEYEQATKTREKANRRIKDAIDYQVVGNEILVAPELYFFDTCMRAIWEMEHWQWDDWRGRAIERKNPKEKTMDKDDHMIECLGRLLLTEQVFIPYSPITNKTSYYGNRKEFDPYN